MNRRPTPGAPENTLSTQFVEHGSGLLRFDAAELVVVAGPDEGLVVDLAADTLHIGSSQSCELVLHDRTVSARHAVVEMTERGFALRDLDSTNGVVAGGLPVSGVQLFPGLRFSLGQSVLEVRALGEQRQLELAEPGRIGDLVAYSWKMRLVVAMLRRLAPAEITVLIEGETGTGKEVLARAVHRLSGRAEGPFVVVDCGAIPADLFGAELLGYEKGAFSGAQIQRPGLLEEANGGTLFLDEIGEVPLSVQPFLLGAIERRSIRRVGGQKTIPLDVRIVAATNRNLAEAARNRAFREDLYHRLAVGRLKLPPLRERREDIAYLARQLAEEQSVELSADLMRVFVAYDWPGNVRELRNAVARVPVARDVGEVLDAAPAGDRPGSSPVAVSVAGELPFKEARQLCLERFERMYVAAAIHAADGNLSRAARSCGLSRSFFMKLAARHNLRLKDAVDGAS